MQNTKNINYYYNNKEKQKNNIFGWFIHASIYRFRLNIYLKQKIKDNK